jgi:hypothetical protein
MGPAAAGSSRKMGARLPDEDSGVVGAVGLAIDVKIIGAELFFALLQDPFSADGIGGARAEQREGQ